MVFMKQNLPFQSALLCVVCLGRLSVAQDLSPPDSILNKLSFEPEKFAVNNQPTDSFTQRGNTPDKFRRPDDRIQQPRGYNPQRRQGFDPRSDGPREGFIQPHPDNEGGVRLLEQRVPEPFDRRGSSGSLRDSRNSPEHSTEYNPNRPQENPFSQRERPIQLPRSQQNPFGQRDLVSPVETNPRQRYPGQPGPDVISLVRGPPSPVPSHIEGPAFGKRHLPEGRYYPRKVSPESSHEGPQRRIVPYVKPDGGFDHSADSIFTGTPSRLLNPDLQTTGNTPVGYLNARSKGNNQRGSGPFESPNTNRKPISDQFATGYPRQINPHSHGPVPQYSGSRSPPRQSQYQGRQDLSSDSRLFPTENHSSRPNSPLPPIPQFGVPLRPPNPINPVHVQSVDQRRGPVYGSPSDRQETPFDERGLRPRQSNPGREADQTSQYPGSPSGIQQGQTSNYQPIQQPLGQNGLRYSPVDHEAQADQTIEQYPQVGRGGQEDQPNQRYPPVGHGGHADQPNQQYFSVGHGGPADQLNQQYSPVGHGGQADQPNQQYSPVGHGSQADQLNQQYSPVGHGGQADQLNQQYSPVGYGGQADQPNQHYSPVGHGGQEDMQNEQYLPVSHGSQSDQPNQQYLPIGQDIQKDQSSEHFSPSGESHNEQYTPPGGHLEQEHPSPESQGQRPDEGYNPTLEPGQAYRSFPTAATNQDQTHPSQYKEYPFAGSSRVNGRQSPYDNSNLSHGASPEQTANTGPNLHGSDASPPRHSVITNISPNLPSYPNAAGSPGNVRQSLGHTSTYPSDDRNSAIPDTTQAKPVTLNDASIIPPGHSGNNVPVKTPIVAESSGPAIPPTNPSNKFSATVQPKLSDTEVGSRHVQENTFSPRQAVQTSGTQVPVLTGSTTKQPVSDALEALNPSHAHFVPPGLQGQCYKYKDLSTGYSPSGDAFEYPDDAISAEMRERTFLAPILGFKNFAQPNTQFGLIPFGSLNGNNNQRSNDYLYSENVYPTGYKDGDFKMATPSDYTCRSTQTTLRMFKLYGGRCWTVNPDYQRVSYKSCGAPGLQCGNCSNRSGTSGDGGRCSEDYEWVKVWGYCEKAPPGQRVRQLRLYLPTGCSCKTFYC
ncbi:trithorax group protein osa-like [Haliotis rufescens]|uniref:trithorax group protein osa-like n=1 Tax=Haliotis rufescens TaxID=6454 RepID=UPI00201F4826|nr:trithorax group protein osa-like [Haliotis rufescens]